MRQIFAFVFCLCLLLFGHAALANFEPVYAPLIADPAAALAPAGTAGTTAPADAVPPPANLPTGQAGDSQQPTAPDASVSSPTIDNQQPATSQPPATTDSAQPVDAVVSPAANDQQPGAVQPSIMNAIARAKDLLAPVLADFKSKERSIKPLASKTAPTAAALAVWNKTDDSVTVYGGTRGAKFFTADGNGPAIPIVAGSGSQTAYRDNDPNTVVVGTVQADLKAVTVKRKKRYAPAFSYYVPYNQELYSTETLAAGSDYLSSLIQDAFNDLDAKGIKSRTFPDQALTAVIDPYLIKSIAVIENADSGIYADSNSEDALGRFLVKLALNQENALGTVVSPAGARGMVQFIPSTYKIMVTKRTDLGLIPDFVQGMADHKNAIKAEAAYLDMILDDMPDSVKTLYQTNRGAAAEYLAAGYNGGSVRVRKAILAWGAGWSDEHASYAELTAKASSLKTRIAQINRKLAAGGLSKQKISDLGAEKKTATADRAAALAMRDKVNGSSLRTETVNYVVKLRRVYDMLAAGLFATPNAPTNALPSGAVALAPVAANNNN